MSYDTSQNTSKIICKFNYINNNIKTLMLFASTFLLSGYSGPNLLYDTENIDKGFQETILGEYKITLKNNGVRFRYPNDTTFKITETYQGDHGYLVGNKLTGLGNGLFFAVTFTSRNRKRTITYRFYPRKLGNIYVAEMRKYPPVSDTDMGFRDSWSVQRLELHGNELTMYHSNVECKIIDDDTFLDINDNEFSSEQCNLSAMEINFPGREWQKKHSWGDGNDFANLNCDGRSVRRKGNVIKFKGKELLFEAPLKSNLSGEEKVAYKGRLKSFLIENGKECLSIIKTKAVRIK